MRVKNLLINISIFLVTMLLLMGAAEIIFRYNGKYKAYMERFGKPYAPLFTPSAPSWYYVYKPHFERTDYSVYDDGSTEFSNTFVSNSEGLLDKEFTEHKGKDTIRIMMIGDSFIQGIGAPYDSSFPKQLESMLNEHFQGKPAIEIWDCGIGGSDPFYEYMLLANKLLKYHPDYIVEALNNTDITDVVIRGGPERFMPDSTVKFTHQSKIEPLYAKSFLVRRIVHDVLRYNWMLMSDAELERDKEKSLKQIETCLQDFENLCTKHHIPLLITVLPMKEDLDKFPQPYMPAISSFCDSTHLPFVDCIKCFQNNGFTGQKGISLYWKIDMHCKPTGYAEYAKCIMPPIIQYLDSVKNSRTL